MRFGVSAQVFSFTLNILRIATNLVLRRETWVRNGSVRGRSDNVDSAFEWDGPNSLFGSVISREPRP